MTEHHAPEHHEAGEDYQDDDLVAREKQAYLEEQERLDIAFRAQEQEQATDNNAADPPAYHDDTDPDTATDLSQNNPETGYSPDAEPPDWPDRAAEACCHASIRATTGEEPPEGTPTDEPPIEDTLSELHKHKADR